MVEVTWLIDDVDRLCSVARSMLELTWSPGHQESDWKWVLFQHLLEELDFCLKHRWDLLILVAAALLPGTTRRWR